MLNPMNLRDLLIAATAATDEPPELKGGACVAHVGDVWVCGRHICGSSSDRATMRETGKGAWLGGR